MVVKHEAFKVQTESRVMFVDVTERVKDIFKESGLKNGIAHIFSQHTTCSVMIQEDSDDVDYWGEKLIMQDLNHVLEKIVPRCRTQNEYNHPGPIHVDLAEKRGEHASWSLNTDAHLKSIIMGRSVTIPVENGELQLGEWGIIYFADFDQVRERERTVRIQLLGE